jgi:hypothetical protein
MTTLRLFQSHRVSDLQRPAPLTTIVPHPPSHAPDAGSSDGAEGDAISRLFAGRHLSGFTLSTARNTAFQVRRYNTFDCTS